MLGEVLLVGSLGALQNSEVFRIFGNFQIFQNFGISGNFWKFLEFGPNLTKFVKSGLIPEISDLGLILAHKAGKLCSGWAKWPA